MNCCGSSADHTSAAFVDIWQSIGQGLSALSGWPSLDSSRWGSLPLFVSSNPARAMSDTEPPVVPEDAAGQALVVSPTDFLGLFIFGFVVVLVVSTYCRTRAARRKTQ